MEPIHEELVCAWSAAHPRHDHQLLFPLSNDRVMLVWCEYYANTPKLTTRPPTSKAGQAGDETPCRISARISTDRCRTFGEPFTLQDNVWRHNVKHPNLLRATDGGLLFCCTGWDSAEQRNVFVKRSDNEAESWGPLQQVSRPGFYCLNHGRMLKLSDGRIVLPAHGAVTDGRPGAAYRGGASKLHAFCYLSDDDFATWHESESTMTAPGRGAHEPTIVELRDGRLLCMLRTTTAQLYRSHSEDRGEHWSTPEPTGLEAPDSEALVTRLPSGELLLVWNHVASNSNWPRTPLTAAVSTDEGESWERLRDLDARPDRDAAYPQVFFQGDEAVVTWYTRPTSWARDCEVLLRIYRTEQFLG